MVIPAAIGLYAIWTQPSYYVALGMTIKLTGAIVALLCLAYGGLYQAFTVGGSTENA